LAENFGAPFEGEPAGHAFPGPKDLIGTKPDELRKIGFSQQKARALLETSEVILQEGLELESLEALDNDAAMARLRQFRGVGRWTAEYAMLRGLGRLSIFPGDDVGAQKNLQRLLHLRRPLDYNGVSRLLVSAKPYGGFLYFHLLLESLREKGYLN